MSKALTTSEFAPKTGEQLAEGDQYVTERAGWSSPITHFEQLPATYWGTERFGWTRMAYSGGRPLRPVGPSDLFAVKIPVAEDLR